MRTNRSASSPFLSLDDASFLEFLRCLEPQSLAQASRLARRWLEACRCDALWLPLMRKRHGICTCAVNLPAWRLFPICSTVKLKPQSSKSIAEFDPTNLHDLVLHLDIYHLVGRNWEMLPLRQSGGLGADLETSFEWADASVPLWPDVELSSKVLKLSTESGSDEEADADGPRVPLLAKLRSRLMLQQQSTGAAITILDSIHSDWDSFEGEGRGEWSGVVVADSCLPKESDIQIPCNVHLSLSIALVPVDSALLSDNAFLLPDFPDARLHAYMRSAFVMLGEEENADEFPNLLRRLEWNEAGLEPKLGSAPLILISKWVDMASLTSLALVCRAYRRSCSRPELWSRFCKDAGVPDDCIIGSNVWQILCYNGPNSSVGSPSQNTVIESLLSHNAVVRLEATVLVARIGSFGWEEVFRRELNGITCDSDGLAYRFDLPYQQPQYLELCESHGKKIRFEMCKRYFHLSHRIRTTVSASLSNRKVTLFDAVGYDVNDEVEREDGCVLVRELKCQSVNHLGRSHEVALFHQLGARWRPESLLNMSDFDGAAAFADPHPGYKLVPFLETVEMVFFIPVDDSSVDEDEE